MRHFDSNQKVGICFSLQSNGFFLKLHIQEKEILPASKTLLWERRKIGNRNLSYLGERRYV